MYDVIVVGAGPAGSVAAKRCSEQGLKTLMVEKRGLPRDKVCSGMVMARLAKTLVEEQFGRLPPEIVLTTLSGLILWVPGAGRRPIDVAIPITWRKDLDSWMTLQARKKGVEVRDRTSVKEITTDGKTCGVVVQEAGAAHELAARFLIGTDGTHSITRKFLFPEIRATYTTAYRECYHGSLDLEEGYAHIVFPRKGLRPNFWVLPKGDCFTLEGGLRELKDEIRGILAPHGFIDRKPLWKDGCLSRVQMSGHPLPNAFTSARANVLLAGDAARLKIPVSGEGIGTALKSGVLAADSIVESIKTGREPSKIYADALAPLLATLHSLHRELSAIRTNPETKHEALLDMLTRVFQVTIELADW